MKGSATSSSSSLSSSLPSSLSTEMKQNALIFTDDLSDGVKNAIERIVSPYCMGEYTISVRNLSDYGENSYGSVLQLKICPKNSSEPLHYVAKLSPKNDARRTQMCVVEYYTREVFVYSKVLNEYRNLQMEYGITSDLAFNAVPRIHYASLKEMDEFIILEDLHKSGYLRFNRHRPLPYRLTALALEELARFHAMSFVLREKKPKLFKDFVAALQEDHLFSDNMEQLKIDFGENYIEKVITALKDKENIPNKNKYLKILRYICGKFKDLGVQMVNGKQAEPFAVICHGDFWNNNVLYKYDDKGNATSAKLLDFQMSRYASPILDIVHYLFVCTEKKLRDEHFEDLKRAYHTSLSNQLKLFDLDPEQIFSFATFEEQLKMFGVYGFCMSVYALPFYISDNIPDLNEAAEDAVNILNSPKAEKDKERDAYFSRYEFLDERTLEIYNKRMIGVLLDLEKYEMINFVV